MKRILAPLIVLAFLLSAGCSSIGAKPAEMILGEWQATVGGLSFSVTYSDAWVQVGDAAPVAYQLQGDRLTYADGGEQVRIVSFPEASVMQQIDPVTGTEHLFSRVGP